MAPSSGVSEKNSPRLIDYIVFVGRKNPSRNGHAISQPELLRVYPPQNHSDSVLPNDIVYFCQPEGCYNTSSRSFILDPRHSGGRLPQNIKMEFFTFMLTDKESNIVRFGICLNFLRPIGSRRSINASNATRRRGTSLKSSTEFEVRRLRSCEISANSSSSSDSSDFIEGRTTNKRRPFTHTLTSICLVSRYQFFKKFGKCLRFLYVLIQKLHEGCKPRLYGRQTVWSVLTGAIESPELMTVRKSVEEIDTWILRLLSTPAPVAGKTAIHAYLQPSEIGPPIVFALPDENRFSLVDYSLYLPLQLLGVEKFLKVFFSLLLEQKVVLESSHHDRLTTCVLAFTALCYPLQYLFTVIPLLPSSLKGAEQLLQAPSPYIIGLPRSFLDSRLSFHLPKDVLLVDLDTQELYGQGAQEPLPKLPHNEEKQLLSQLNKILTGLHEIKDETMEKRELKNSSRRSSLSELNSFELLALNHNEESLNLALRVAMVQFFMSPNVLGGFAEHTRTVRIYPRPVVAFQYERFMKSRPEPSPFTVVLAKTQAVEYFAEWSLMPDNLVYQRVNSEDLRPSEVGDRDKWFSDTLSVIPFHLWTERFDRGLLRAVVEVLFSSMQSNPCSSEWSVNKQLSIKLSPSVTVSSTSGACEVGTASDSETPTDVSGSNESSRTNSDTEHFSDLESGKHAHIRIADIINEFLKGNESLANVPYPAFQEVGEGAAFNSVECMQFGKELPSNLRVYYSPPMTFVIPDLPPQQQSTALTPMSSPQDPVTSGNLVKEVTQRLTSADPPNGGGVVMHGLDSPQQLRSLTSTLSTGRASIMDSAASSHRSSTQISQVSQSRSTKSTLSAIIDSWFVDAGKSTDDVYDEATRKQRLEVEMSENQRFISDCVTTIRRGNQPGVFSRRRLQRLMEEEVYRNFILALTNGNIGHPVPKGQNHITDVFLDSWDQYKVYVWLFTQIGIGIRQSCRPMVTTFLDSRGDVVSAVGLAQAFRDLFSSQAEHNRVARGGICSAFSLLEMAHTHHHLLPKRRTAGLQPLAGSFRGSSTPLPSSVPASPKKSITMPISPMAESKSNGNGDIQEKNHISDSGATFNVINTQKTTASQLFSVTEQRQNVDEEISQLTASTGISMDMVEDVVLLPPFKSAVSLGYRYRHGRLFQTASQVSPSVGTPPPCISVPALRISLADQRSNSSGWKIGAISTPEGKEENGTNMEEVFHDLKPEQLRSKIGHTYLFEEAMINSTESKLWTSMQFWEDLFLDTVTLERDLLGMDFDPSGLLEHYSQLGAIERKRLELSEDALLAGVMHNLIAFMVMARVPPDLIRFKVRRLIAKSHTGLHYTQKIAQLLDCLEWLRGNDIDLLPISSRQFAPEIFSVCPAGKEDAEMLTMMIYNDFIMIRSMDGSVLCRWWFDQIINVIHSPQKSIIIFQTRFNKKRVIHFFTTSDINSLFTSIASAIKRARSKSQQGQIIEQLGGRVNVIDKETGNAGEIDLSVNGFHLTFGNDTHVIPLDQVEWCNLPVDDVFSIAVAGHGRSGVVWNLKTDLATLLMNQWERLIGVAIAKNPLSGTATPISLRSRTSSTINLEALER